MAISLAGDLVGRHEPAARSDARERRVVPRDHRLGSLGERRRARVDPPLGRCLIKHQEHAPLDRHGLGDRREERGRDAVRLEHRGERTARPLDGPSIAVRLPVEEPIDEVLDPSSRGLQEDQREEEEDRHQARREPLAGFRRRARPRAPAPRSRRRRAARAPRRRRRCARSGRPRRDRGARPRTRPRGERTRRAATAR
jgi:hypothetical protein